MGIKTDNMIFVFGSNLAGIHGAGAAAFARNYRGAAWGVGVGKTGQSYAIPTKGCRTIVRGPDAGKVAVGDPLELETIRILVSEFITYAERNPQFHFQVTRIGCGLAGLKDEDIAPMFAQAPKNCWFDSHWQPIFDELYFGQIFNYWGTFG